MTAEATRLDAAVATAATPQPAPEPPPWNLDNDSLAHALAWLSKHHGRERSVESLLAGLPVSGPLEPGMALRVLREAGYNAGLLQRRLDELHSLLLPAVLLLKNGSACLLTARDAAAGRCEIVLPGRVQLPSSVAEADLQASYAGVALVATPQAERAASTNATETLTDPGRHWLWGTVRRFAPYYRSALLAALLSNALMMVTGIITSVVYDKVIPNQAMVTMWAMAAAGGLALLFDLVARQLRAYLIDMAGRKTDLVIGATLFRQSLAVRMENRPESSGAYAHVLGQIEMVREFFSSATMSAISDLPFIFAFVAMTFVIGGPLGWVLVIAIPLILGFAFAIQGLLRRLQTANMQQTADLHGVLVEAVDGMEDLKAAGAQGRFVQRYESTTALAAETALRSRSVSSWTINLSGVSQQAITLVMLLWGVHLIQDKLITGGMLIGAVMFAGRAIAPLTSVVMLATRFQGAMAALRALNKVMEQPTEREAGRAYLPHRQFTGRIGLNEVSFAYPPSNPLAVDEPTPEVLKGVTLRFAPGERVAILGRIGSGKSTILRLLAGLYQPTAGQAEADSIDLRQFDPADYRARVGFVAQDPRLFNGTLRDNVLLERPSADPARLADVARLTGLQRLVSSHPMGWELPVGQAGCLLSGGQRQLVALARCLVTQPKILLMDEPTSSMDAQSEVAFLRQLHEASGDCTLIMVTHRPAVLELVNRVIVVDNGRVVLDGPKAQVLAALSGSPSNAASPAAAKEAR
ncbi:type I secretion system permease/ATPase [Aquabacterium sp.]|uniref:type I secretion system permease/ATPase n=1 Tax=Aquabacterium sp. TaxID=1872578 RepID=UPI002C638453|nr:type I secretion system permease/ATPase [Aquabacterium sp.]HSW05215.1 type I secretion system permease/ATPase [Aquabacterium sp.]